MPYDWVTLYNRIGEAISQPTADQMAAALADVFAHPDDPEHFECWIECGKEEGPLVCYAVTSKGNGRITTYSDADMIEVLSEVAVEQLNQKSALEAWRALLAKAGG